MNVVILRDEDGSILEAYSDTVDIKLHFADLDHSHAEGPLKTFNDELVDHWSMDVATDPALVASLLENIVTNPTLAKVEQRLPLAESESVCQFCGAPASITIGGISSCDECDETPSE